MLDTAPGLATESLRRGATRDDPAKWYFEAISHYVYEGDTALHVAAATYDEPTATKLVELGADANAANRRGATPLHYACDGVPDGSAWDPEVQAAIVTLLIASGANVNGSDKSGVAPLHRAVRTRCSAAVRALLDAGADASLPNHSGSTPLDLARMTTGRGGSGSLAARREQQAIIEMLTARGA
jgi:hypothetical protein